MSGNMNVDTLEGRAMLQRDLDKLEEQADKNSIEFNKKTSVRFCAWDDITKETSTG